MERLEKSWPLLFFISKRENMSRNEHDFKKNLQSEVLRLQKNVTINEAILLKEYIKAKRIRGNNPHTCIYGAMTDHCESERAKELKGLYVTYKNRYDGTLENYIGMTPIEILLLYISYENSEHRQTYFAQHIYNAITGGAIDWPYFDQEINKLFTV